MLYPRVMRPHTRILVADDDPGLLAAVCESFEHLGADVVAAQSGDELMEQLGEHGPFDLVVTDVSMPWMSGLQAMHSVRTAGLGTPVIIMTALRDQRTEDQALSLGRDVAFLRKPFALVQLEAAAATLLARSASAEPAVSARS